MNTPVLLLLSALVTLGHWLLLAPTPEILTQLAAPHTSTAEAPVQLTQLAAVPPALRTMQTRRIEAAPVAARVLSARSVQLPSAPRPSPAKVGQPRAEVQLAALAAPTVAPLTAPFTAPPATPADEDSVAAELAPETSRATSRAASESAAHSPSAGASQLPTVDVAAAPAMAAQVSSPLLAAPFLAPVQLPKPVQLNYEIQGQSRGLGYRATAVLDWQQDGSRYEARLVANVFFLGSRTLSSVGAITADGLAPMRFSDKARSEQAAHFQADKGKISFSANQPDAPWQRGVQDRLSVFFQLAGMLAGQPERFVAGTHVPVYTASARGADIWAFVVKETETLNLPAGTMPAIKLTRQSRRDHEQLVELWFAPTLSYWPVRIKLTQANGDFVDQQLAGATP